MSGEICRRKLKIQFLSKRWCDFLLSTPIDKPVDSCLKLFAFCGPFPIRAFLINKLGSSGFLHIEIKGGAQVNPPHISALHVVVVVRFGRISEQRASAKRPPLPLPLVYYHGLAMNSIALNQSVNPTF